ncbi:MAG: hypothetical protein RJA22_2165 [Verrucomicrobiota bacterium]
MSRNAPIAALLSSLFLGLPALQGAEPGGAPPPGGPATPARVVTVHHPEATAAFQPRPDIVRQLLQRGLLQLTGQTNLARAWLSLVSTQDVVGIKVYAAPGASSGTRPAVVAAVVEGLLAAGLPRTNIVIWDRQKGDLRLSGFADLAESLGVRCEGAFNAGFDPQAFYEPEQPVPGTLVFGDLEFGQKGDSVGRRSHVSTLVSQRLTRLINVTPMLNHNAAGVCGHLFSLATGSVDNVLRFELSTGRLATAVPEIYALPWLSDRVVLNITDALICQYHGEQRSLLHYSTALNQLRLSRDPVALDLLSLRELDRQRAAASDAPARSQSLTNYLELIENAALLQLGTANPDRIRVERPTP